MKRTRLIAFVALLGIFVGAGINLVWVPVEATDGPLTVASNLRVRTDENGYLLLTGAVAGATPGPLTNFGNIRLRTDENGYLLTAVVSGTLTPTNLYADSICVDQANFDACLSRLSANIMRMSAGDIFAVNDGTAGAPPFTFVSETTLGLRYQGSGVAEWVGGVFQLAGNIRPSVNGGQDIGSSTRLFGTNYAQVFSSIRSAIGVTSTDGLTLTNPTAAAAGAQQMPPRIRFDGFGWKTDATAASQAVSFINELLPVQGAAAPTANLLWKYAVNGGAYATVLTLTSAGGISTLGAISSGGLTIAGAYGVPNIVAQARATAQTGVNASVATYTVGAADGTFEVSANCLVTTSTNHSFSLDVTYTDEGNTARTLILPVVQLAGTFATGGLITNVTGAGPYESAVLHIRAKAATAITVRTSAGGTYTTVTYNVDGTIKQVG